MDSNQILIFLVAAVVGIIFGALITYIIARKTFGGDEAVKHEFEKQKIKLETDLANTEKLLEVQKELAVKFESEKDQALGKLNQTQSDFSVAKDRIENLTRSQQNSESKIDQRSIELRNLQEQFAQASANYDSSENNLDDQKNRNKLHEAKNEELMKENTLLSNDNAKLTANLQAIGDRLETQKVEIEDIRKKSHLEFENIAAKILENKTEKFTETNRENIQKLLEPLGKDIVSFKTKVEETYDKESKERFSLDERVKELIQQTGKVSAEANNLAAALKGQAKTQGNWGEMILERILEINGLVKGREYDVQHSLKNEDGAQQYLDVVVNLPDDRKLIIDSKVTLNAYERYCSSETDEERAVNLKDHNRALLNHIDQLSSKKYDEMETSPDFVMLFVPIEPAYLAAIQYDGELWAKAYAKRILLISPTNLMAAVAMVSDLWKRDQQSKNALEIADQGQKLYDKFVGFLNSLEDVGSHIDKSRDAYEKAMGQLKKGRGNLISRAEKLKELGIKSSKALPASMQDFDDDESGPIIEITGTTADA